MAIPFILKKLLVRTGVARFFPIAKRLSEGGTEYLHYYSDRILAAPIDKLRDPAILPQTPGPEVMNLNLATPQFDSPVSGGRISADRSGNPPLWGLQSLRKAIATAYNRRDQRTLDPNEEVLVTHGATAAFTSVLDAFVNPGDKVVLFDPCSPLFSLGAKSRRASVRWVPTWSDAGRLRFDPDQLGRMLRGAKLLAFADPCNPTGATLNEEDLERIAVAAEKADALIYLDESFGSFRYDSPAGRLATLPGMNRRTLSVGSVTQGFGLGSTRIGWITGPKHLIKACALTANLAAPFVPTICQQVAQRAVEADEDLFGPVLEEFRSRRQYTHDKLQALGLNPIRPTGGYFFWISVAQFGIDGRTFAERLLQEQQVLVGPGAAFGPSGNDFVRISFAAEDGRLSKGLKRLSAFIATLRGTPQMPETPMPEYRIDDDPELHEPSFSEENPPSFSRV